MEDKETKAKSNYWLKSGIINILQNMSGVLFGFGSFFFLVRGLSESDYGAWTLFLTTTTILNVIRDGLLRNALIKFLSGASEEDKPKIMTSAFTLNGLITLFCVVLNLAFVHFLTSLWEAPELVNLFYLFNIVFIINGILTQFNCIEQANLRFGGIFTTSLINGSIFFSYVFSCFLFKRNIELMHLVEIQLIAALISTTVSYFFVKDFLIFARGIYKDWILKIFNYGKYAFGTSVSSILSGTIDQIMLGSIVSKAASGAFSIAVRIINIIDIPTSAVAVIVFPQSAKRIESEGKEAIKYLYEKSVGTILAILIPGIIFVFIFSDLVIFLIAEDKFEDAVPLLRVALLYSLLIPFGRQFGTILDSIGKTKTTFYIVVFTASFNLILNYFMISSIGIMGAAYATLISNIVGFIIAQIILKKELNVNVLNTFIYAYYFYPEFYEKFVKSRLVAFKIIKEKH